MHFARKRFGRYDVIDFLAVLFGYAISGSAVSAIVAMVPPSNNRLTYGTTFRIILIGAKFRLVLSYAK
ncbi:hypothetical protein KDI_23380 [Dictyobacter arantiisoli]|uniref:Uncharacterized protein n=1 Tax=Dictyobacter arantiisoli TaxID=2014874 RepID=A0A5A5TCX1_9CHLR|nr:hypothetical protein KDI_23380 [Dictyobacter arantiisoli]